MKYFKSAIVGLLIVLGMASCDKIDNNGPFICPPDGYVLPADQIIINGLNAEGKIDFSKEGVNIVADLGEKLKWTLRITSDVTSKEYSGWSDSVNVWWFGNVDRSPVFGVGKVKIQLEIACIAPIEKELESISKPTFKGVPKTYGLLLRDWDKNGFLPVSGDNYNSDTDGWAGELGDKFSFDYHNTEPSPAGGNYCVFEGNRDVLTWYFGGHSIDVAKLDTSLSTDNTDSLYLNFYARGYGIENSNLEVGFKDKSSNTFIYTKPIDWIGWEFVSIPLSDFLVKAEGGDLTPGAKLQSMKEIAIVILQLGCAPERSMEAKSAYDFMFISVGTPFFKN